MDEKDFAIRLARLREKKGVSARDMSLSIGQNPGYINNIERENPSPLLMVSFSFVNIWASPPANFLTRN